MAGASINPFTFFLSWAWQNENQALVLVHTMRKLLEDPKKIEEFLEIMVEVATHELHVSQAEEAANEILGRAA